VAIARYFASAASAAVFGLVERSQAALRNSVRRTVPTRFLPGNPVSLENRRLQVRTGGKQRLDGLRAPESLSDIKALAEPAYSEAPGPREHSDAEGGTRAECSTETG
jgi:hypothetical protein